MAWGSGLSNFGQAYKIGDAQNPFFNMQGMLPQAGLQPGGIIQGAGGVPPILGRPMLPPGVTPEMAALPQGIPGLGAPLGKTGGATKPIPVKPPTKVATTGRVGVFGGGDVNENRRDHDRPGGAKAGPDRPDRPEREGRRRGR